MTDATEMMMLRARQLSRSCQEILSGQGDAIQSVVLADLLSLWLAGHFVFEGRKLDRRQTDVVRESLLDDFIKTVRAIVPESEKEILQRAPAKGSA